MPRAPKLEYPPLMLYMIFPAHAWFSTGKIKVKLAYTYKGRTKIYFLKWGVEQKSLKSPDPVNGWSIKLIGLVTSKLIKEIIRLKKQLNKK